MGSRQLVILTVIVFLLTGSLGTYLYIRLRSSDSVQQEFNKETIVAKRGVGMSDEEVLIKEVEWKPGDSYISVGVGGTFYIIKLVTDGEVIRDPIEIKTKEDEVLATAIVTIQ